MAPNIQDFRKEIKDHIKDGADILGQDGIDRAISSAKSQYDKDKPREVTEDINGDGSYDYALSSLTDWSEGFSSIRTIEYPAGESRDPSDNYIPYDKWIIYDDGTSKKLRLLEDTPQTGEKIRVTHTVPHVVNDTQSTVPNCDFKAVAYLSAARACAELANYYTQRAEMKIMAEYTELQTKADDYREQAKVLEKYYERHIGLDEEAKVKAASGTAQYDIKALHGRGRLTH